LFPISNIVFQLSNEYTRSNKMNTRVGIALFLVTILTLSLTGAALAGPGDDAASKALAWLATKQNADGGFSDGFSPKSGIGSTSDAVVAIVAAGQDPGAWKKNGVSPLDYLEAQVRSGQVTKPGDIAKTIIAVVATGGNPRSVGGVDLVTKLNSLHKAGSFGGTLYEDALAVLALVSAGQTVPQDATTRLIAAQTKDGAWAFTGDTAAGAGDTNTTALVVQALIATGHRDAIGRALDYFRRTQNDDAGWPYQVPSAYGTETDANSTANVIQALIAAGESLSNWSKAGRSDPLGALIRLQDDKTGAFNYQASSPGANLLATLQAVPALKGVTFVHVLVVRASSANPATTAPAPQTLPVAGAALPMTPLLVVGIGAIAALAGYLIWRKA
jgi:hypothetical protein